MFLKLAVIANTGTIVNPKSLVYCKCLLSKDDKYFVRCSSGGDDIFSMSENINKTSCLLTAIEIMKKSQK